MSQEIKVWFLLFQPASLSISLQQLDALSVSTSPFKIPLGIFVSDLSKTRLTKWGSKRLREQV